MKKSYSLLGSDHLNLLNHLEEKKHQFDSLHFDIIDENYCGGLGLSILTLEQLCMVGSFQIDVHVLMKNPFEIIKRIAGLKINNINLQVEHLDLEIYEKLKFKFAKKGLAIGLDTDLKQISKFINKSDSILLLCMKPSLNHHKKQNKAILRVEEFRKIYPDYKGDLIVDGGFDKNDLPTLKNLNINTLVIGRTFIN